MDAAQIVTFFLTSSQPRAWLVIHGDRQEPHVVEMWNGYANHWSATAWLHPGDYRCRYYCGDDTHAVYHGPAHTLGKTCDEMDGLVSVDIASHRGTSHLIEIPPLQDNFKPLQA